jgi:hypothetical protein
MGATPAKLALMVLLALAFFCLGRLEDLFFWLPVAYLTVSMLGYLFARARAVAWPSP